MTENRRCGLKAVAVAGAVWILGTGALTAQVPERNCAVSILNQTAFVQDDDTWILPNVPSNMGPVRARVTCVESGQTLSGASELFTIKPDRMNAIPKLRLGQDEPVPGRIETTSPLSVLTTVGQTVALSVMAHYADGSSADVTAASAGTIYRSTNPATATVDADGVVTAVSSGRVLVTTLFEAIVDTVILDVLAAGDSDGDGLADDFEVANGLDPNNPADALDDPDGDGLTNLEEFLAGLDLFNPDSDSDGLRDGDETRLTGSDPLLFDTDGDGVSDGLEVLAESDPLDPLSVDLAPILESLAVDPPSFTLIFNTVIGEASRRLQVTGTLIDGTVLDVTGPLYGVTYSSSDLTIANFGSEAGRVFAGLDGTATVTASVGTFVASSEVTVRSFSPTALSFIRIPGFANDVAVQGDYAYVAAGARGLYVVNVASPEAPAIIGVIETPGNANGVAVDGDYVYVADGGEDLRMINVSIPGNPVAVSVVDMPGRAVDVVVGNERAYVAAGIWGLHIVDVMDPTAPVLLGSVNTGDAHGVEVVGDQVMIADGTSGVLVIDASDPTAPAIVGTTHTRAGPTSAAAGVAVRDGLAWVADGSDVLLGGLKALDISEPTTPAVIGSTSNDFGLTGVAIERDFALASDYFFANAVPIFNIAGPTPVFTAVLNFSGAPSFRWDVGTGIAVQNGIVFLTGASGSEAFDNEGRLGDTGLHIGRYLDVESISNIPPEVALVAPADGSQVLERRRVTVRAEATDDVRVEVVEFLIDGESASQDYRAPFEHTFFAPLGPVSLTLGALARDRAGNQGAAEEIVLDVLPDATPTVSILSPRDEQAATEGTTISVAVLASDDAAVASVELTMDGVADQILSEPPYIFSVTVPVGMPSFDLVATVRDDAGQTATSDPLSVAILADQPPSVAIVEPTEGAEAVAGGSLRVVAGAADDQGVERVRFIVDGQLAGEDVTPPYELVASVPSNSVDLTLVAEAIDTLGQVGVSEEIHLEIAPDPLTTLFGRVTAADGSPIAGAEIETTGAIWGITGPEGFFSIAGLPTTQGDLTVFATAEVGGVAFVGESAPATPIAGGITDAGDLVLSEAQPSTCPCVDPANWNSDFGGTLWQDFFSTDPGQLGEFLNCADGSAATVLTLQGQDDDLFFSIGADAVSSVCEATQLVASVMQTATLTITVGEAEACREALRNVSLNAGVACMP